jgi:uncharacterized protein
MILPDVNVLLYAFRRDAPEHRASRAWLDSIVNGSTAYGMSPQVLAFMIRIATHPRVYAQPSRLDEAVAFCNVLLEQPHCQIIQPGPGHWEIYCKLCRSAKATGNLTQDAWFAALAIESGCEWITTDRHYARFGELRWRAPF